MMIDAEMGAAVLGRMPPVENIVASVAWLCMAGLLWFAVLRRTAMHGVADFLRPEQQAILQANRRRWQWIIGSAFLGGTSLLLAGGLPVPVAALACYLVALIMGLSTVYLSLGVFRGLRRYEQAIDRAQVDRVREALRDAHDSAGESEERGVPGDS